MKRYKIDIQRRELIDRVKNNEAINYSPTINLLYSYLADDRVSDKEIENLMLQIIFKQDKQLTMMYKEHLGVERMKIAPDSMLIDNELLNKIKGTLGGS